MTHVSSHNSINSQNLRNSGKFPRLLIWSFFRYQKVSKPNPILFRNQKKSKPNPILFSIPKNFETNTNTFSILNFFESDTDIYFDTKFFETDTDTIKTIGRVSKPRSSKTKMSHSDTKSLWFHDLALFVRLFCNVCYQMFPQIACLWGCKVTLVAFVWLFSTVRFQM